LKMVRHEIISESQKNNISFQLATSEHAFDAVLFHNSYYGTARSPKDWLWEYKTYKPDKSVFVFAKHAGKIIATQGMLPICVQCGQETIFCGKSESTLLLSEYRGTLLMQNLYEYAVGYCIEGGMRFIWGFTPAVKAFNKFGFVSYKGVRTMVRRGNIWAGIRLKLRNKSPMWRRIAATGKLILKHYLSRNNVATNVFHGASNYELRRGITDETCLKALFSRLKLQNNSLIYIRYDQEYFKWRVRENPSIQYTEYQVYNGNELKAFAIVALVRGILSISDLTSEDENAAALLLQTILHDFSKIAAEYHILINTQDILNQGVLKQLYKFKFSAGGTWNLVVRDLTKGKNKEIFDVRNWHINGLWTEGYSM